MTTLHNWFERAPTGQILRAIQAVDEPAAEMGGAIAQSTHPVDPLRMLFVDGALQDFGPPPSPMHVLDAQTQSWVLWGSPGTTQLQVAQAAKWEEIKAERDQLETAGFPYLGKWIDSDARSVQRITGAVQAAQAALAAGTPFEIGWTSADNSVLQLDAEQMMGMTVALAAHANDLHVIARGLRALIYAEDATEASVAAVAWPPEEEPS